MEDLKKWVPALGVILVALIFTATATSKPWWTVNTSGQVEFVGNSTAKAEYGLSHTVTATLDNKTETLRFENLTGGEAGKKALSSAFNTTFALTMAGLAVAIVAIALTLVSGLLKPLFTFASITAAVAGILLLAATLNLASSLPPAVAKLNEVIPLEIPSSWVPLTPKKVTGFWGSLPIPSELENFPEWSWNMAFWNWGPAFGWHVVFVASLLLLTASAWSYVTVVKREY